MSKKYWSIALAYVGVIVGAGLSSGQDLLQYFLSFGKKGMLGVVFMGALNIFFGRVMVTLGSYYRSENHQDVFNEITHPTLNKVIDATLIIADFVMGFVMLAGAGANLEQQFSIPASLGALGCAVLIILVAFMDFDKITRILGIFTPIMVIVIMLITAYTFIGKSYDWDMLDQAAKTVKPAIPNIWVSTLNYFALCALTGVSMAFLLGGSVVRIGVAEKGGTIGGIIIGVIVTCASATLFANVDVIKGKDIPMLVIVDRIHPVLAPIYALTILALIFNTAFSLFYAIAKRFASDDIKKMRIILIITVVAGYICSFGGFKTLISKMYPILGYMGIVLLLVLAIVWVGERNNIKAEKLLRRNMIKILLRKYDDNQEYTPKDKRKFRKLSEKSVADTKTIREDVKSYVEDVVEQNEDLQEYVENSFPAEENTNTASSESTSNESASSESTNNESIK